MGGRDTSLSAWGVEEGGSWALVFWGRAPGVVGAVAEQGPPVGEVSAETLSVGKGQGAGQGGSGLPGPFDPERPAGWCHLAPGAGPRTLLPGWAPWVY